MKASDIITALSLKFPTESYAFFTELNEGVGAGAGRRADAVAIGLWPSRGLEWIGFEVKVTAGDLARELEQPSKAEAIARHLDRWYLVTPVGLTKGRLIPPTWGVMEVDTASRIRVVREAAQLEGDESGFARRSFMASVARHAQRLYTPRVTQDLVAAARAEAQSEGYKRGYAAGLAESPAPVRRSWEPNEEQLELAKELRIQCMTRATLKQLIEDAVRYQQLRSSVKDIRSTLQRIDSAMASLVETVEAPLPDVPEPSPTPAPPLKPLVLPFVR